MASSVSLVKWRRAGQRSLSSGHCRFPSTGHPASRQTAVLVSQQLHRRLPAPSVLSLLASRLYPHPCVHMICAPYVHTCRCSHIHMYKVCTCTRTCTYRAHMLFLLLCIRRQALLSKNLIRMSSHMRVCLHNAGNACTLPALVDPARTVSKPVAPWLIMVNVITALSPRFLTNTAIYIQGLRSCAGGNPGRGHYAIPEPGDAAQGVPLRHVARLSGISRLGS